MPAIQTCRLVARSGDRRCPLKCRVLEVKRTRCERDQSDARDPEQSWRVLSDAARYGRYQSTAVSAPMNPIGRPFFVLERRRRPTEHLLASEFCGSGGGLGTLCPEGTKRNGRKLPRDAISLGHEMAAISGKFVRTSGGNHEEVDERGALCWAADCAQGRGEARTRQIDHSRRARARG